MKDAILKLNRHLIQMLQLMMTMMKAAQVAVEDKNKIFLVFYFVVLFTKD
jgi:hypothetical protein